MRLILSDLSSRVKSDVMAQIMQASGSRKKKRVGSPAVDLERWGPKRKKSGKRRRYRDRDMPDVLKTAVHAETPGQVPMDCSTKQTQSQADVGSPPENSNTDTENMSAGPSTGRSGMESTCNMNPPPPDFMLCVGNTIVNRESWKTLNDNVWLDDCIIDGALLASAAVAGSGVAVFSVHAMDQVAVLPSTRWMTECMRRKYGLNDVNTWLVPFNTVRYNGMNHWALFVVARKAKRLVLLDSMLPAKPYHQAVTDLIALVNLCRGPEP